MTEQAAEQMHKFWEKQPVISENDENVIEGYIDQTIPVTSPPDQPAPLPKGFSWTNIDITNEIELKELHDFLYMHYIEDDDHKFRFHLSSPLLRWSLMIPGFFPNWIFGVRSPNKKLVGFISGIPLDIRLHDTIEKWCAVDFLCVHSSLRSKNLASILIFELARRVRIEHIYRAVFSGSNVPSKPFLSSAYVHRPINLKVLTESGFYYVEPGPKRSAAEKKFSVPRLAHINIRPFTPSDSIAICNLLNEFNSTKEFSIQFTPELVEQMFTPQQDVVYSYIIPDNNNNPIGFYCFYIMNWTSLQEEKGVLTQIKAAYSWYFASKGIDLKLLFQDMVHSAANDAKVDIMNALQMSAAGPALTSNKFMKGDKILQFYSYNYAVSHISDENATLLFV